MMYLLLAIIALLLLFSLEMLFNSPAWINKPIRVGVGIVMMSLGIIGAVVS